MMKKQVNKKAIIVIVSMLLISCLFIFKDFLFGNRVLAYMDIGSDTYDQYLMHYQSVIQHIREGNFSLWDFNNGYGVNMFTYNLFDPFLSILYMVGSLFGGEQIYGVLVYWMILHVLLAGITGYWYLSCFSLSERAKVPAAYIYALCGYMVVWGQHYQFGTVVVLFPLLLMAVERCLECKKWYLGVAVVCGLASLSSLYMTYMQLAALGFYVLFRVAWKYGLCTTLGWKKIGATYGSMVLGIGMGAIQLLPSAVLIVNVSGRVGGTSLLERVISSICLYPAEYYKSFIKHLFSSNLNGCNLYKGYKNFYEDPNVFLSVFFLIAVIQFVYIWCKEKHSIKEWLWIAAAGSSIGLALFIPLGSMIFNGFVSPFSRHVFLFMPWAVWMMAYVLQKIVEERSGSIWLLVVTTTGVVLSYVWFYRGVHTRNTLILGVMAALMGLALIGIRTVRKKQVRNLWFLSFTCVVMITMISDSYQTYAGDRTTLMKDDTEYFSQLYDEDVAQALAYIESVDASFYRVEKDYTVGMEFSCLNGLVQNYRGVSTYNSILNEGVADYLDQIWPEIYVVNSAHCSFAQGKENLLAAALSNVKYVLSKEADFAVQGYELIKECGDVFIYKNQATEDAGKLFTKVMSTETYENISQEMDCRYLLSEYLICDTAADLETTSEEIFSDLLKTKETVDLSERSEGIFFENPKKGQTVRGTATVSEDGVLMLPIPYESGWHAYVNGKEQELHKVNYGFCGLLLDAGSYDIMMTFECPGFATGAVVSLLSMGMSVSIWIVLPLIRKKRSKNV